MKREYPTRPIVSVGAVVVRDSSVLLVKRDQEPSKGFWSIPGGVIELGESFEHAVQREVQEETGIEVTIVRLLDVAENIVRDDDGTIRFHYVLVDYLAHPITSDLSPRSDVSEARWVDFHLLDDFSLSKGTKKLIEMIIDEKDNQQATSCVEDSR